MLYDASGAFGQCLEAPYLYLRDCVLPSDFFSFILPARPVLCNASEHAWRLPSPGHQYPAGQWASTPLQFAVAAT